MINHPSRIFSVGWLKHPLKFRQRLVNTSFHLDVITYPYLKNSNKNPTSFSTPSLSEWRFIFIPRVSPCALLSISLHRTGDNLSQTARICAKPLGIVLFQSLLKIGPVRLYHVNNCVVLRKQSFNCMWVNAMACVNGHSGRFWSTKRLLAPWYSLTGPIFKSSGINRAMTDLCNSWSRKPMDSFGWGFCFDISTLKRFHNY